METITIQDVADEAGVSISTVSRVINNNYPVGAETRKKVEKAIKKLNFTPNVIARGLIQKKSYIIGVLAPSIANLFFPLVVDGIESFFREKDYQIIICNTGGAIEEERRYLRELPERQIDGIISIDPRTANILNGEYERAAARVPLVLINGHNDGIKLNFVLNDQESGAMEALEYLYSLGHREIAFLGSETSYSNQVKERVYRKFLEKHGIAYNNHLHIIIENSNSIKAIDFSKHVMKERLAGRVRPTAVFACNDWMAVGTLYAAQVLGLKVPDDLSVVGFDNIAISEIAMPKLTTVDQNMQKLGNAAAEHLYSKIKNPDSITSRFILDTKLIVRESCAPCKI